MSAYEEDYDEELHDDPIKLCFKSHHSSMNSEVYNMPRKSPIEIIDLTNTNEAEEITMAKPLTIKGDVCYQIKQLAIEIVDFRKFPWYFRKRIKYYNNAEDINNTQGLVVYDDQSNTRDMCMKIKYDNNEGQWKVQEGKKDRSTHTKDRIIPKTKFHRNLNQIDFKRNKGLIGLTITQKFVTEDVVVKKDEVSSGLVESENETTECILNMPVNIDVLSNKNDKARKEVKEETITKEKSIKSIATQCKGIKITEILNTNDGVSNKSELTTEILKKSSENGNQLKVAPRKNKIKLSNDSNNPETYTKLMCKRLSSEKISEIPITKENKETDMLYFDNCNFETTKRLQQKCNKKEQQPSVEIKVQESKSNMDRADLKKNLNSSIINKVCDNIKVRKDLFDDIKPVSERKIAVIDNISRQFQTIKTFADKTLNLVPKNKLKSIEIEAAKCNDPKPLDMPVLIEKCTENFEGPSKRSTSLKDSIVFENDGSDIAHCDYKRAPIIERINSSNQQALQRNSLEISKNISTNSSNASSAKLVSATTTSVKTGTPHTNPVASYINMGISKPRVKYTPMTGDYTASKSINVTTNEAKYSKSSQSLLRVSACNTAGPNAQDRSMLQILNDPQNLPIIDTIQHRLPLQQMPQYPAPPSYPSNYPSLPSYVTAVTNSHLETGYRMYGNNTGGVNSNFHSIYPGYGAPQYFLPPQQAPQWQANANFNANRPLHNQSNSYNSNSASTGWNNRYVMGTNIFNSTAPSVPTNTKNLRMSFDNLGACTQPASADGKFTKHHKPKTPTRKNTKKNNQIQLERPKELVVIENSSKKNTLKRPYDISVPEVARVQYSAVETELTKRPKTAPLFNEVKKIKESCVSPPILCIPTNEPLSNFFTPQQPAKPQENIPRDAKCVTRKTPAPRDKTRKISIEDYKKRICENYSADFYNSAVRASGNIKDAGHEPNLTAKKSKYGNYYLEQDLGYSSDTTVKL